jgi:hypothetical protein
VCAHDPGQVRERESFSNGTPKKKVIFFYLSGTFFRSFFCTTRDRYLSRVVQKKDLKKGDLFLLLRDFK